MKTRYGLEATVSNRWIKYGIAGAVAAAAGAYAWRWAKGYRETMQGHRITAEIMAMVPEDVIPCEDIDLGEIAEFDGIVTHSCFESCCYTPLSGKQREEYGYSGPAEYLGFDDEF